MMRQFFMGVPKELNEQLQLMAQDQSEHLFQLCYQWRNQHWQSLAIICVYIFLERLFYNIYYDQ